MAATSARFDAFLSYSRRDAREAEVLAGRLAGEAGLAVWLDRARLQPGASWRGEIEEAMNRSGAAVVLWGPDGLGPVQRQERDLAYALRDARPGFEVLYVFLPGTPPPQGSWANVDTWIRFEGGLDEADPFARLVAALKGEAPPAGLAAGLPDEPAPYRGLAAFGVDDRRFFFGRGAELGEMQERLAHHPFLAVLGPSGSGKTSLVQAGLLARLPEAEWEKAVVRPGTRPLRALAGALARFRPVDPLAAADDLTRRLEASPGDLPELLDLLLPEGKRLALVVDRLEELFTLAESAEEVGRFLAAVLALAPARGRSWVIATMRADFYGRLGRHPELAGEVVDHQLYIKDMGPAAVAEVIEAPAAQVGAVFEKGLAARVRDDASQDGAVVLPLLQHALDLLWRKRRGRWLTWEAYEEVGGVQGALRYHADRAVEALGAAEREVARGLLTRLVWIEESTAAATAGRRLDEASLAGGDPRREQVLQRLADERLVVLRGAGDQATVELVHDTLPLHWQRLRGWVQEDREFLLWRQRLRADLAEWQRTGGDEGTLLRGAPLVEAERWLAERRTDLGSDEAAFIAASAAQRDRERTARERLRRRVVGGLAAGLAVALGLALLAFVQWRESERQRRVSLSRQLASQGTPEVTERLDLALLLGVEAYRAADTFEAKQLLLLGLDRGHQLDAILHPPGGVGCFAMDPSGRLLATGNMDGALQLWDLRTRRPVGEPLKGLPGLCSQLALGPGGETLAAVHSNSSLIVDLWDLSAAKPVRRRVAGEGGPAFFAPSFSPGRTTMALAGEESLAFWDLETRRPLGRAIPLPPDPLESLEFVAEKALLIRRGREGLTLWHAAAPPVPEPLPGVTVKSNASSADGRLLALGTEEGSILRWDLATRRRLEPIETGFGAVTGLAFRSDGRLLSAHSQGLFFLWDPRHPRPAAQPFWRRDDFEPEWLGPGGRFVMGRVGDGVHQLVQLGLRTDHSQTRAALDGSAQALVSPDGNAVAVTSRRSLRLLGLRNEPDELESFGDLEIQAGGFTPDSKRLVTIDSAGEKVILWNTEPRRSVGRRLAAAVPWPVDCLAWSPDGDLLAWGTLEGSIALWHAHPPHRIERLPGHREAVLAVAFSPDGRTLASCDRGSLLLRDVATRKRRDPPLTFAPPDALEDETVSTLSFTPDGKALVAGTSKSRVLLWDLESGRIQQLVGESSGFAVHPRRPLVAIATEQEEILLVDLESRKPLAEPLKAPAPVVQVEFAPDGETLAASLDDDRIALLALPEGKAGRFLAGRSITSLSFDGAGGLLAATELGSSTTLWDVDSGRPALPPFAGDHSRMRLNPRRPLLATTIGQGDGLILWDLDVRHWARRACRIANRNLSLEEWRRYVGEEIPYRKTCPGLPPG